VGQEHVGGGEAGSAPALGLRINGMRQITAEGVLHRNKAWGETVTANRFAEVLEQFLTDDVPTLRSEVATAVVDFLNVVEGWVSCQTGLKLLGTSVMIVYEGDSTVASPLAPVVKMVDFEHVEASTDNSCDEGYLTGIRNLRWMLERVVAWGELQTAKAQTRAGQTDLHQARDALRAAVAKCGAAAKKAAALSPDRGLSASTSKVLHEDIMKEDVAKAVMQQEDSVIAGFLKAVLSRHRINAGPDAFVELLQWRTQPLIMDRVFVKDLLSKYGINDSVVDDLLKWKESSDTRLRDLSYVYDVKLSAAPVLPSYYDLLVE